jgi:hypothetical protein
MTTNHGTKTRRSATAPLSPLSDAPSGTPLWKAVARQPTGALENGAKKDSASTLSAKAAVAKLVTGRQFL